MTPPETIGSTLGQVAAALAEAGFDDPRRRARRVVAAALALSPSEVFARLDRMVSEDEAERVAWWLRRVLAHEPLSRIRGEREFWGLRFGLTAATLDPRPESETIVEAVLARLADRAGAYRFLDLGTGTGCLLLALLSEFPQAAGIGVDRSFEAALGARRNAERLGLAARAGFAVGDWMAGLSGRFDAIVANPPYIATAEIAALPVEVRNFDPRLALDGGGDGLAGFRAIAPQVPARLAAGGIFVCEIGSGQDSAVGGIIARAGLVVETVVPDLAGIGRCVVAAGRN